MAALAKSVLRNNFQKQVLRTLNLISSSKQQFSTSQKSNLKEIKQTTDKSVTTVEGVIKKSSRAGHVIKLEGPEHACPLCRLNMDLKYTDVLILSQFLRPDGCILPRKVTGVCNKQQKRLLNLMHQAQRAGLMPNYRPDRKDGKERTNILSPFKWRKYHVYFSDDYERL